MKKFSRLIYLLGYASQQAEKINHIIYYMEAAEAADRILMINLFRGEKPKRIVSMNILRQWVAESRNIHMWLMRESYIVSGDWAETLALAMPKPVEAKEYSLSYWMRYIEGIPPLSDENKKKAIQSAWAVLTPQECFVFNKIITATLRLTAYEALLIEALTLFTKKPVATISQLLNNPEYYNALFSSTGSQQNLSKKPFIINAVLLYAQRADGIYSNYTFGIWKGDELVSFAKISTGLSAEKTAALHEWIDDNTIQRAGPVRITKPSQLFEITYESLLPSSRHKSGFMVIAPRILRWLRDVPIENAASFSELRTED